MEKCSFDYRLAQRCADQEVCTGDEVTMAINKIDRIDVHLLKTVLNNVKSSSLDVPQIIVPKQSVLL